MRTLTAMRSHDDGSSGPSQADCAMAIAPRSDGSPPAQKPLSKAMLATAYGGRILDRFTQPTMLIDEERRIVWRNAAASRYLAETALLFDQTGVLSMSTRAANDSLLLKLQSLGLPSDESQDRPTRALLRVRRDGTVPMLIFLQAIRPEPAATAASHRALALIIVHDPRKARDFDPLIVREAFDLTSAEARVAIGLAQGLSVTDLADTYGVSVHTLRAQVRSVMQKLGTGRQSDIVRMLAGLPCLVADGLAQDACEATGD